MVIERDGKTIELTDAEIIKICIEAEEQNIRNTIKEMIDADDDLKSKFNKSAAKFGLTDDQMLDDLASEAHIVLADSLSETREEIISNSIYWDLHDMCN